MRLLRRRCVGVVVLALASCDTVFEIDPPDTTPDAPVDAPCPPGAMHDEDGDLQPDVCDACPGVKDAPATNNDPDAIPDACDPRPDRDGDFLAELITFGEGDATSRWMLENANWWIGGDALHFSDVVTQEFQAATDTHGPFPRPFAVTARLVVETVPAVTGQIAVFANDQGGLTCGIKRSAAGTSVFMFRGVNEGEYAEVPIAPMAAGSAYVVELVYDEAVATATCRMRDDRGATQLAQIAAVPPQPPGPIGAEGWSIAGRFEYLAVYRWPPER